MKTTSWLAALALLLAPASVLAHPPDAGAVETVALFDFAALETPESIAVDVQGNLYVSLALTGEIRRIAPDGTRSTFAVLPLGAPPLTFCGPFFNAVTGITLDKHGNLYASLVSCDAAERGVWKIYPDGSTELLANLPLESIPNGIAWYRKAVYVADSTLGVIWRVPEDGGEPEIWLDHPFLKGLPTPVGVAAGVNGLQIFRGDVYVSNSGQGTIVVIPVEPGGAAGDPALHATLPAGIGCDDFALDVRGSVYCGTGPTGLLLRIDPDGSHEVLLSGADGLDGPTAAAFGRTGRDRFTLFITSGAFPFLPSSERPSVTSLHLGVPGAPPAW